LLFTIPFKVNNRRGLELDHWLTIWYRDYDEITNQSILAAVEACHGMTVPCHLRGDFVVTSGQRGSYTGTLRKKKTTSAENEFLKLRRETRLD
jgi:hypothetical protein